MHATSIHIYTLPAYTHYIHTHAIHIYTPSLYTHEVPYKHFLHINTTSICTLPPYTLHITCIYTHYFHIHAIFIHTPPPYAYHLWGYSPNKAVCVWVGRQTSPGEGKILFSHVCATRKTQFSNGFKRGFPFARDLWRPTQTQSALYDIHTDTRTHTKHHISRFTSTRSLVPPQVYSTPLNFS
jgi:hypothetical protein